MAARHNVNVKRLTLLLWLLVAVFYFYLSYDYIQIRKNDGLFADYLQHVVQLAGTEGRSAKDIRALLLVKAEQLSLPVRGQQIVVKGNGNSLDVAVNYDVDIEIPLIERGIYTKNFDHKATFQGPR
jgi:hypothetical protein